MKLPIYFDYAATTPIDPRVAQEMSLYLTQEGHFANPSSSHVYGKKAKEAVEQAREHVANLIGAEPAEIIWTSGATEANNLALKGAAELYKSRGKHIVTMKTEHPSVLECCQQLEKSGFYVTYLSPEKNGLLDLQKLKEALRDDTVLVSIMYVNNETGVIQDISAIADLTFRKGILFHVDAAQAVGKLSIDLTHLPVDLMSFCAHKLYGPKGIGALYVRRKPRVRVAALIHGGGHEQGMRSGTLPTHQIVGMGRACAIAKEEMEVELARIRELRNLFYMGVKDMKDIHFNTAMECSVPAIFNFRIDHVKAEMLMEKLSDIAFSSGSACSSKGTEPSYVLRALGQSKEEAACGVRFSLGRFTQKAEIDFVVERLMLISHLI